jgi:predicted outer membrane repeat protein
MDIEAEIVEDEDMVYEEELLLMPLMFDINLLVSNENELRQALIEAQGIAIDTEMTITLQNDIDINTATALPIIYDTSLILTSQGTNNFSINVNAAMSGSLFVVDGSNFTIENVKLDGKGINTNLRAIFAENSRLRLLGSSIQNFISNGDGGGMFLSDEVKFHMENSTISHNEAGKNGGGVFYSDETWSYVRDSTISHNKAGENGGGIVLSTESCLEMYGSAVIYNTAVNSGGGMHIHANEVGEGIDIVRSIIGYNEAQYGGGIYVYFRNEHFIGYGGGPGLRDSTVRENTAVYDGGGIYALGVDDLNMDGTTIVENTAGRNGGGIYADGDGKSKEIVFIEISAKIEKNIAGNDGGGIYLCDAVSASVRQTVIEGNIAGRNGGGIYAHDIGYQDLYSRERLSLDEVSITGNIAEKSGGGMHAYDILE